MGVEAQIASFEGGELRVLASGSTSREAVLALPLSRLLVKMVRVPAGEEPEAFAAAVLKTLSPYPDEALTVSCETVCEDESARTVIAAAMPESAADDIGEALDAAKLNVVRIDSLALGQLRGVWSALGEQEGRRLVALASADCLSIIVLDDGRPSAIRAITDMAELSRETMLSLLEAEDFGGARKLVEIVVVKTDAGDAVAGEGGEDAQVDVCQVLSAFAPTRVVEVGRDAALVGVRERSADDTALNALPDSWREVLVEARFKRKLWKWVSVSVGLWALAVAVLFGVPAGFGFMTDHQKALSKRHARRYADVKAMKAKVDLIHKYSDHARGALEIMKALSDRLPTEITLTGWTYKRDEGVRVTGEAETAEAVYSFKDAMDELSSEGENGERVFGIVNLSGPTSSRGGYRFDMDCQYKGEDEE